MDLNIQLINAICLGLGATISTETNVQSSLLFPPRDAIIPQRKGGSP